ncbi:hypothetical protein [Paenibacillus hubeiensis]|uniref:hypothetical protein n=1 Tax=Paenibacillus hubeiensis TaxID=3077330 RepID=UPI0031BAC436
MQHEETFGEAIERIRLELEEFWDKIKDFYQLALELSDFVNQCKAVGIPDHEIRFTLESHFKRKRSKPPNSVMPKVPVHLLCMNQKPRRAVARSRC